MRVRVLGVARAEAAGAGGGSAGGSLEIAAEARRSAERDPAVRAAMELFDGRLVRVEKRSPGSGGGVDESGG